MSVLLSGRVELISDYIYDNIPVIISVVFENKTAHALLAVGIEVDSNEEITKIYCLDPGYPSPRYSSWNCFIDVSKETKSDYPFYCVCEDGYSKVSLDDMLIIDKE